MKLIYVAHVNFLLNFFKFNCKNPSKKYKCPRKKMIAHKSSSEDILKLRQWFIDFDSENDGIITFEELKKCLEKINYSDEIIKRIFASIDINENGYIMYTEFLAATLEVRGQIEEERIVEAFNDLDKNKDNFITKDELLIILGRDNTEQMVNKIMAEADLNKDGKIDYQEFLRLFRKQTIESARSMFDTSSTDFSEVFSAVILD